MLVSFLHSAKVPNSILVTELGIVTLVRLVQPSNALHPILVTESGIVTLVMLLQPLKALYPIFVTESGIEMQVPFPLYFIRQPFPTITKSLE